MKHKTKIDGRVLLKDVDDQKPSYAERQKVWDAFTILWSILEISFAVNKETRVNYGMLEDWAFDGEIHPNCSVLISVYEYVREVISAPMRLCFEGIDESLQKEMIRRVCHTWPRCSSSC